MYPFFVLRAAILGVKRADAGKENMGPTHWIGEKPSKSEASIAKNYLAPAEFELLNRIGRPFSLTFRITGRLT